MNELGYPFRTSLLIAAGLERFLIKPIACRYAAQVETTTASASQNAKERAKIVRGILGTN